MESQLFLVDRDYYAAFKMLESIESNLIQARYHLIKSYIIMEYSINIDWEIGYLGIFNIRALHANDALMWYNTVYDTMLQMVYFAFGLYKKIKNIK